MKLDFKINKAFSKLVFELLQFTHKFYNPANLKTFGLDEETINDKKNLPMILEYARITLEYMKKKYDTHSVYDGYHFLSHADIMEEQFNILEPFVNKIIKGKEFNSQPKKTCVKRLFVFLKKFEIYNFLSTGVFVDALMEIDMDEFWEENIYNLNETIAINTDLQYIDVYEETFIQLLARELSKNKDNFIIIIDHIINALISHYNIRDFDYNGFSKRILDCGFKHEDISKMECLKIKDISEMLDQIPTPKVLPEGIDYQKYGDIFNQLKLPSIMFRYIFVCENILRKFIIQALNDNGYPSIESIGNGKLTKAIQDKKQQESNQNYLPIRGDHDIYYLDLIELNRIIMHLWNECFKDKFERQSWICERIESLYAIRNRVAHSSGYLKSDEMRAVDTRCIEIIKQIDQYIK